MAICWPQALPRGIILSHCFEIVLRSLSYSTICIWNGRIGTLLQSIIVTKEHTAYVLIWSLKFMTVRAWNRANMSLNIIARTCLS